MVRFGVAAGSAATLNREHACAPKTIHKKFTLTFPATETFPLHWGNHHQPVGNAFPDYAQKSCDNKGVNYGQWRSVRYVITVMLHEDTLTEINELIIT